MKKHILGAVLFAMCGSAALAAPAFAQTSQPNAPTPQAATPATHSSSTKSENSGKSRKPDAKRSPLYGTRMCVRDTGSLIPAPPGQCLPVNGNSYSQRDLRMTGQINTAQALQMLDPSVTAGH